MAAIDTELIIIAWEAAVTPSEKEAAGEAMAELEVDLLAEVRAELEVLEPAARNISEWACEGTAGVWDFIALPRACEAAQAVVNWTEHYPPASVEWDELGRRILAVLNTLAALEPSYRLPLA